MDPVEFGAGAAPEWLPPELWAGGSDAPWRQAFERVCRLARELTGASTASVSLLTEDKLQILCSAGEGLQPDASPGEISFCALVVEEGEPLIVDDVRSDDRLATHSAHARHGVAAYAGVPLRGRNGQVWGALCAREQAPYAWTESQVAALKDLAALASTELELRSEIAERERAEVRSAMAEARAHNALSSEDSVGVRLQDFSARMKVESERRRIEQHYRDMVNRLPIGIYELDEEGRFIKLNPAGEEILGRPVEEVIGNSFLEVIAPRSVDDSRKAFARLYSEEADLIEVELTVVRPDGEERTLAILATSSRGEEGGFVLQGIARDVTPERQAENALRESEEILRQIAENIREVFFVVSGDLTRTIYLTGYYEEAWAPLIEDIRANPLGLLSAVHPDDLDQVKEALDTITECMLSGIEFRLQNPSGESWVRLRGYPVKNDAGEVYRVVGAVEDITDRKDVETALRESEQRLQEVLRALPLGIILTQADGRFAWYNEATRRIWPEAESAGPDNFDSSEVWLEETGARLTGAGWPVQRAIRGEAVVGEIQVSRTASGHRRTTRVDAVPLHDAQGAVNGSIVVLQDLTEERAREEEKRILWAAFERLTEGIGLLSSEGEIIYANGAFARLLALPPERVEGFRIPELDPAESGPGSLNALHDAVRLGRWSGRVWRKVAGSASPLPIDVSVGRVETVSGAGELLYCIARDASEQIDRERQLRQSARLASLSTLIAGMAHELNNPLNAVLNYSQLLIDEEDDAQRREDLMTIHGEAKRIARIVADLRMVAGRTNSDDEQKRLLDVNEVVSSVLLAEATVLRDAGIAVEVVLAPAIPPVLAQPASLAQVVRHLVRNSRQAIGTASGAGRLRICTEETPTGVMIAVRDDGPGMDAATKEQIFDPFFTTRAPGEGAGLGLSVAHGIVTDHGGHLTVISEPGAGSEFQVHLPRG